MDLNLLSQQDDPVVIVGFFDLMGWMKWSRGRPPGDLLELSAALMQRAGGAIADAGGLTIKAIGDAGLFIFPPDDPDTALAAVRAMKADCDKWLGTAGYPEVLRVSIHVGPVACAPVGAPGRELLDIYGEAVNYAAIMKARPIAVSAVLAESLSTERRVGLRRFDAFEFALD